MESEPNEPTRLEPGMIIHLDPGETFSSCLPRSSAVELVCPNCGTLVSSKAPEQPEG